MTTTYEECQLATHLDDCVSCASHLHGYVRTCATGRGLTARAFVARRRQREIEIMQRLQERKAQGEFLDHRSFRELAQLERTHRVSDLASVDYCPHWTRDQGCPLHGELCSPERHPDLRRQVLAGGPAK